MIRQNPDPPYWAMGSAKDVLKEAKQARKNARRGFLGLW
jgi:hypothetical protein